MTAESCLSRPCSGPGIDKLHQGCCGRQSYPARVRLIWKLPRVAPLPEVEAAQPVITCRIMASFADRQTISFFSLGRAAPFVRRRRPARHKPCRWWVPVLQRSQIAALPGHTGRFRYRPDPGRCGRPLGCRRRQPPWYSLRSPVEPSCYPSCADNAANKPRPIRRRQARNWDRVSARC